MAEVVAARWLLLIHQIPPTPAYLRVKVGRRLQGLGSVALKNSVYLLPRSEQALEDFQWVRREILAGHGEATVCEARFVEGHTDADVEALFSAARDADYASLAAAARDLRQALAGARKRPALGPDAARQALLRLRKQLSDLAAIDFFGAAGRATAAELLAEIEARLRPRRPRAAVGPARPSGDWRGRTWVTRRGVAVDRVASAWLIRRLVDPEATFKFVDGHVYAPLPGELRFDMFEAEFTHEGDQCTFEVLVRHFGLTTPPLRNLAEVVHDVDLKDAKFARPEAAGLDLLITGMVMRHEHDEARIAEGAAVFDSLYEAFQHQR